MEFTMATALDLAIVSAVEALQGFSIQDNFWDLFETAFGQGYDRSRGEELRSQWHAGDAGIFPDIEILSQETLGSAVGAYSPSTGKIYLSDTFLASATDSALVQVLLEEYGHFVDAQVNIRDSLGDEGAIFAELILGKVLNLLTLQGLKAEDDSAWINVNGQAVLVEQADFTGTSGNDTLTGTSGDDTISPLRGNDSVDGGEGNDLLIINYSTNTFAGSGTYPSGISSGFSYYNNSWHGNLSAYFNSNGSADTVQFYNIESLQITGTPQNDTIDRGGYDSVSVDGGAGTDTITYADLSSITTGLTINNSGTGIFTQANGTTIKNVERFSDLITGIGNDAITFTGRFNENVNTGDGDDTIALGLGTGDRFLWESDRFFAGF